jgi:hypothetical protein
MDIKYIALVSDTNQVQTTDVTKASAALQKQVLRDFAPIWNQQATVDAFEQLEDVPIGHWPVIIRDDIGFPGAAGIHLDQDGQPFGLVQFSNTWQLTASHEILEMLADPFGNRLIAGNSIKPRQGRVEYLVEVCDPSEAIQFGYSINGIQVSDFYTPQYFDPVTASGVRYSFTGAITSPRDVLKDGYLSWHDPVSGHWFQQVFFGTRKQFRDLGVLTNAQESIRTQIDRITEVPKKIHGWLGPESPRGNNPLVMAAMPTVSKAENWRTQIQSLKQQYAP